MRISDWSSDVCSSDLLVVLVKGGADSFVGKIVIVDGPQRLIFCADERRFAFSIPNALSVPRAFIDAGIDLPELLGSSKATTLRSTNQQALPGALSEKQRQPIGRASCRERVCQYG